MLEWLLGGTFAQNDGARADKEDKEREEEMLNKTGRSDNVLGALNCCAYWLKEISTWVEWGSWKP